MYVASIDTAAATELCVRTMRQFAGHPFDLTVGDGGSTDGSLELLRELEARGWPELEVSSGPRLHAQWLDDWLVRCDARFAVFVDSDVEFRESDWLADLVDTAVRERAAIVCAEECPEQPSFVEPVAGRTVRLAARPAPWLLLVDVAETASLRVGFGFRWERSDRVPEGLIAHDVGATLWHAAQAAGMRTARMPDAYRAKYVHYAGMSGDALARAFDLAGAGEEFRRAKIGRAHV